MRTTEKAPTKRDAKPPGIEENLVLAQLLDETAEILEAQHANQFRVRAYREAARELRQLEAPVRQLWDRDGREALIGLPRIGKSLSRAIDVWLLTGTLGILQRVRGDESAERILMTVPGIGRELAHRIHHNLGISSLEDFELSVHDGRLAKLEGIGPRRLQAIGDQLETRLRRTARGRGPLPQSGRGGDLERPSVREILDVDREYRDRAAALSLPRIAPRRFNPSGEAWLPILHTRRGGRHYTALFSNTAQAHSLKRTDDWVVIYVDEGVGEHQWTVVTEPRGPLAGQRVVRGRERECMDAEETRTGL